MCLFASASPAPLLAKNPQQQRKAQVIDRYGEILSSAEGFSLWTASILPMTPREKHKLLSGKSTAARLLACEHHLASLSGGAPPAPPGKRAPA